MRIEAIQFGTAESDAKWADSRKKSERPKKQQQSKPKTSKEEEPVKEETGGQDSQMVCLPQLPKDWIKSTRTGNLSFDLTKHHIDKQLKRTIPEQQPLLDEHRQRVKKRKKTLKI